MCWFSKVYATNSLLGSCELETLHSAMGTRSHVTLLLRGQTKQPPTPVQSLGRHISLLLTLSTDVTQTCLIRGGMSVNSQSRYQVLAKKVSSLGIITSLLQNMLFRKSVCKVDANPIFVSTGLNS